MCLGLLPIFKFIYIVEVLEILYILVMNSLSARL